MLKNQNKKHMSAKKSNKKQKTTNDNSFTIDNSLLNNNNNNNHSSWGAPGRKISKNELWHEINQEIDGLLSSHFDLEIDMEKQYSKKIFEKFIDIRRNSLISLGNKTLENMCYFHNKQDYYKGQNYSYTFTKNFPLILDQNFKQIFQSDQTAQEFYDMFIVENNPTILKKYQPPKKKVEELERMKSGEFTSFKTTNTIGGFGGGNILKVLDFKDASLESRLVKIQIYNELLSTIEKQLKLSQETGNFPLQDALRKKLDQLLKISPLNDL